MASWISDLETLKPLFVEGASKYGGLRCHLFSGSPAKFEECYPNMLLFGEKPSRSLAYQAFASPLDNRYHVALFFGDAAGAERFADLACAAGWCLGPHTEHLGLNWQDHQAMPLAEPVLWIRAVFELGHRWRPGSSLRLSLTESDGTGNFEYTRLEIDPFLSSVVAINMLLDEAKTGEAKTDEPTMSISPADARNKFIYEQCRNHVPYKNIASAAKTHPDWEPLTTDNGVKLAANRYALKYDLPPIPERQGGRRPK